MRKEQFEEGQFYHIYNRGVDKRRVFLDDRDKTRFINTLYILNNFLNIPHRFDVVDLKPLDLLTPIKPFVDIVAGCIMPNHFHLMLSPRSKKGVSSFLHKVGTSYSMYFNIRRERTGRLFESVFKAKHIDRHEYANYLTQYIHLNPARLFSGSLKTEEVLTKLANYQWSTLPDYLGKKSRFSPIISGNFRTEILGLDVKEYEQMVTDIYLEYVQG